MISPAEELAGAPLLRREVTLDAGSRRGRLRLAARVEPRRLRGLRRRRPGRSDDVLSPGWSSYEWRLRYRSYDVTALLRETFVLGFSLGNGWYRGRLGWTGGRAYYGDRLGLVAQLEVEFADGHRQVVVTDETLVGRTVGDAGRRPLRRPDDRRAAARRRLAAARRRSRGLDRRRGPGLRPAAPGAVRRATRRAPGEPAPGRDLDLAVRPDAGRLRPEPRRLAPVHRPRRGRPRDHPPARRGPRGRRARRPAAAHRAGDRPVRAERRRRLLRADQDVPRLPLRRGHRVARTPASSRPTRSRPSSCTPTCGAPGTSSAPTTCSTSCTATRSGGCGATSSTSPPTVRSATSGWGGRATSPSSPPRRPSSTTSAGFLRDWLVDLAHRAAGPGRAGPLRRPRRPQVHGAPDGVPGPGVGRDLERRGRVGALGAVAGVRRPVGAGGPVRLDGRPRASRRVACCRRSGLWDTGFQFGDWLDPQAHPDRPFEAKADNGVVATACVYRSALHGRRGGRADRTRRGRGRVRPRWPDHARGVQPPLRPARRDHHQRRPVGLRPGGRLRSARRRRTARRAGDRLAGSSPRTATAWPRASPGRRTSPTR